MVFRTQMGSLGVKQALGTLTDLLGTLLMTKASWDTFGSGLLKTEGPHGFTCI